MKQNTIYALGFFDGVHLGHQALLKVCRILADSTGSIAGVATFGNHPDALTQGSAPRLINTLSDRKRLLEGFSMDQVLELPFDEALKTMPWEAFLDMLCAQHAAAGFVCGDDFRFGHKGEGTAEKLKAFCESKKLPCVIIPEQLLDGVRISSTHIRQLLEAGDVANAHRFLGHRHILTGTVVAGRQLGRTIGIPTANLQLPEGVVCPRFGVYACHALVDGKQYPAVTNIGTRPTVGGHHVTVEPWILDFSGDLYGKKITLEFAAFLRPETKFDSLEELKAQIRLDAEKTRQLLK